MMEENKNSEFEENAEEVSQTADATELSGSETAVPSSEEESVDNTDMTEDTAEEKDDDKESASSDALSEENPSEETPDEEQPVGKQKMDRVSIIIISIMAVMIVALSAILIFRIVRPADSGNKDTSDTTARADETTASGSETTEDTFQIKYVTPESPVEDMSDAKLGQYAYYDYDLSQMVTLPDYKNIQVDAGVTQEMVDNAVKKALEAAAKSTPVTDRPIQEGDTVDISFVGYVDGEQDDNCTGNETDLVIGSNAFIDGFESGLIGKEPNTNVTLNLTFPENYRNTEYAGKAVTFEVTINSVSVTVTPELTDEFVAENTDQTTVDEYLAALRVQLHEENYLSIKKDWETAVLTALIDQVKVSSVPQEEYRNNYDYFVEYYHSMATYYGYDLETFLTSLYGITLDEFYQVVDRNAQSTVKYDMALSYIARLENLTLTDDEYQNGLSKLAAEQNTGASELENAYGKDALYNSILTQKTVTFIMDHATILNAPLNAAELDASLEETTATTTAEPSQS